MLIITPNRRLTAFSMRQNHLKQFASNQYGWETPGIYSIEDWCIQLWQLCLEIEPHSHQTLINSTQQQILLERIIQQSDVGVELLRAAATAKNVLQAWKFLRQWCVPNKALAPYAAFIPDTAVLVAWLQTYQDWLQNNNYTDQELMLEQLTNHIPRLRAYLPTKICLRGFSEIVPQYAALFDKIQAQGVEITHDQLTTPAMQLSRVSAINTDNELQSAARWAFELAEQNPQQIVGVVVPELSNKRKQVEAVFSSVIPTQWVNISAPLPLAHYTLIDHALLILQLAKPLINFCDLTVLLRSPYIITAEAEQHQRAILDRKLRTKLEAKLTWQTLLSHISDSDSNLTSVISNFTHVISNNNGLHDTRYWAQQIQKLLNSWCWPGDRQFTKDEADLYTCWNALISEYIKLASILPDHSYAECLQLIQRLAIETPFSPAETGLTRVHVLGILEADGLAFDNLWVTGMDRDSWPQIADPNPFIPLELQRKYDLPKSSPQRELKVAQRLTRNLMQGAKQQVIFSYAAQAEDHQTAPSNLIVQLSEQKIQFQPRVETKSAIKLEQVFDSKAPPITENIKGGTHILKLQAQCPFRANATMRLGAEVLEEPHTHLSPAQRGEIVHLVLERFWQQYKDRSHLLNTETQATATKLEEFVTAVLLKIQQKMPHTMSDNYLQLEKQQTLKLISKWLQYEKQRDDFKVQVLEQMIQVKIGPLELRCKIDRVDQLSDGGLAIIDYKTGAAQPADWFSHPILEPQLPLYAIAQAEQVVAVVFAHLQTDNATFRGVAVTKDLLPQVDDLAKLRYSNKAENWSQQLEQWRASLEQTAIDFSAGNAQVKPHSAQVCTHCNLHSLCRIYDY